MRTVTGPTDSVVIVGAGLGGLSAALRLAGAGRAVTVVEQLAVPGGRAGRLDTGGYTFDTGPTVLTMPDLIADALACVGEELSDRLDLVPLDPAYRARFADGSTIDVHTDTEAMTEEIARTCSPADVDGYRRFVTFLRHLYATEMPTFIDRNLDSVRDVVNPAAARLLGLGALRRLTPKVSTYLHDERLQRMFSFQALYAGVAPQQALSIYAVIAYMDCVSGVFFPRGGMHAVPRALAAAAAAHGVDFRYSTRVERIEITHGRATAVVTDEGERIAADVVVVNADLPTAYDDLLPPEYTPRRVGRLTYSPSCALLHVGSSARYPDLAHHTISFGQAWRTTFSEIIDRGEVMSDPSILVSNPSATDESLAPQGKQTYYVLFPTPNRQSGSGYRLGAVRPALSRPHGQHARAAGPAGIRRRYRGRAPGHAGGLGGGWPRGGRPVLRGAQHRPDRTVPRTDTRPPDPEPGLLRCEHPARRRRADGADLRTPCRTTDSGRFTVRRELDAAGIVDPGLRADYEYCRRLNAAHGRTYFLAARLLPARRRPAVHALYAFARTADEILDDLSSVASVAEREAALDALAAQLLPGADATDPACRAARHAAACFDLDHQLFLDFLASMRMDLTVTEYATYDALCGYMHGSAAVIGLQMLPILGTVVPAAEAAPYAADLGVAFQLTNFIRDVGEDLRRGRIYLPQDSLRRHGVDRARLERGVVDDPIRSLLAAEIARTRTIYAAAEPGIDLLDPAARHCVRVAFTLYRDILDEVERADFAVLDRRVTVGLPRRVRVAAPGLARAVVARFRAARPGTVPTDGHDPATPTTTG